MNHALKRSTTDQVNDNPAVPDAMLRGLMPLMIVSLVVVFLAAIYLRADSGPFGKIAEPIVAGPIAMLTFGIAVLVVVGMVVFTKWPTVRETVCATTAFGALFAFSVPLALTLGRSHPFWTLIIIACVLTPLSGTLFVWLIGRRRGARPQR